MNDTNYNPKLAKKDHTGSLSKEEIEKETSSVIDNYNAYALKNLAEFRWIRKVCSCGRQKGPKSAGEAMIQKTCRGHYPRFNVNLAH